MKTSIKIKGVTRQVMTDGEDNAYTPQGALMSALEDRPGITCLVTPLILIEVIFIYQQQQQIIYGTHL